MTIKIENLTMKFGEVVAVNDLTLEIDQGEMVVLLGPSGCGKTTTMRCIVGLEEPATGRISVGGKVMYDSERNINVPASKREIGMVFQSYAIWPHMTVAENISFPLKMKNVPKEEARRRVRDILEMVGLSGFEDRGASMLSGGQMQRVAVARSVVMRPQVMLFDEPLSNLDAKLRDKLRFELREIQQRLGITGVYVTHDQGEALALADRIAVMRDGVIAQIDNPIGMYRHPASTFIADFLGMENIFPVKVAGVSGDTAEVLADNGLRLLASTGSLDSRSAGSDEALYACIRPQDVELSEESLDGENVWPARVRSGSFLGDRERYHVGLGDGLSIYVSAPATGSLIPPDSHVSVRIRPTAIQLLAE